MFKKIIAWMLLITVTATVAIGGTLAYLTDRDSEANVFTVGDVTIDLEEDFQQGAELIPGVEIEKKPTITNIGKNDAWVWATIAVPGELADVIAFDNKGANWENWIEGTTEIDGKEYVLYTALYPHALAKDAETTALFEKVALDKTVDIDPEGKWFTVVDGNATDLNWTNENGNPVIYVSAYAMQKENFNTVQEAYDAYNAQWGENGGETPDLPNLVYSVEELREAMKIPGAKIVLGKDIDIAPHSSGYCLYAKYDCEIDLNGHSINADWSGEEFYGVIYALKGAQVDIVGKGGISINGGIGNWIWCTGAADAATNKPADGTTINIYGGDWTQNSSDFDPDYCEGLYANRGGIVNIYGGTFDWQGFAKYTANESRNGVITIYGGTFINFDPRVSHDSDGSYVADGYKVISETQTNGDIWYTVVKS